ncbi:hypothetical protein BV20DRAFT_780634 [Pilatotrama ljubarskyi]|nr:hypothetical protein BV20DRAFT_780634 [Pilatotrama ljubarskyi]
MSRRSSYDLDSPPPTPGSATSAEDCSKGYQRGHICCIYESTATPIERILEQHPTIKACPALYKKCKDALERITAEGSRIGKERPCVLLCTIPSDTRTTPTICIMATFCGAAYEELSEILKIFCIPVSPNLGQEGSIPLHTTPEWPNSDQWIIAYPFDSTRYIKGFWRAGYRTPTSSGSEDVPVRRLTRRETYALRDHCERAIKQWFDLTAVDPNFAIQCAIEHRQKKYRLASCGSIMSGASTKSCASLSRCPTPLAPLDENAELQPLAGDTKNMSPKKARGPKRLLRRKPSWWKPSPRPARA